MNEKQFILASIKLKFEIQLCMMHNVKNKSYLVSQTYFLYGCIKIKSYHDIK